MMSAHRSANSSVSLADLEFCAQSWVADSVSRQLSPQTVAACRIATDKLLWWLRHEGHDACGPNEIRGFLAYVGAPAPSDGRWGNPKETGRNRPRTVHTYWERLRTFFRWAVEQELLDASPMEKIRPPVARRDQLQPFTDQQVLDLLSASKKTKYPQRDEAICLLLLDTAMRASELCGLRMRDFDLQNRQSSVLGKGNKRRLLYMSEVTAKAVWKYLRSKPRNPDDFVFMGEKGMPLTRSGLRQLMERLGKAAGIEGARCSPHTWRHTAALSTLKQGMHPFTLREMLGHTDLTMTQRYVAVADADVREQHDRCSPVRRIAGR